MRKEEYIHELRARLQGAQTTEIEEAIRYCEEYFDEAGENNVQQVIDDLGMPSKFAAQIKAEATIRRVSKGVDKEDSRKNTKSLLKSLLIILVGICALPIALPLLVALMILLLALFIIFIAFIFIGAVAIGAAVLAGIPMIFSGIFHSSNIGDASMMIGAGLLSIGLGIILALIAYFIVVIGLPMFTKGATCIYNKAKKGGRHEKE